MLESLPKNKANFYKKIAKNKFENQPYSAPAESYDDDVRAEAEEDAMLFVCKQALKINELLKVLRSHNII